MFNDVVEYLKIYNILREIVDLTSTILFVFMCIMFKEIIGRLYEKTNSNCSYNNYNLNFNTFYLVAGYE